MRCVILQLVGKRHPLKVFSHTQTEYRGETETERQRERESKAITFRESLFGNIMAFPFLA